jgi:adenosylcobinamide kinase/adenosylcobinamide-phosphate guanylyltransferase
MKILYYGGQKSGKSRLAERKALALAGARRPYYVATYDASYSDGEMAERIARHRADRGERFVTIEEPRALSHVIEEEGVYLIDCMSMWILNTLEQDMESLIAEIETLSERNADVVFVLNDVGSGVIPTQNLSRRYIDRTGIIGQKLARICDEVYEVKLGIEVRIK